MHAPKLLSYEQRALAHFILQSNEDRARILAEARRSSQVSGALIHCYKWALTA